VQCGLTASAAAASVQRLALTTLRLRLLCGDLLQRNRMSMGRRSVEVFQAQRQDFYRAVVQESQGPREGQPGPGRTPELRQEGNGRTTTTVIVLFRPAISLDDIQMPQSLQQFSSLWLLVCGAGMKGQCCLLHIGPELASFGQMMFTLPLFVPLQTSADPRGPPEWGLPTED